MIVRAEIVRRPDGQTESQCGIFEAVENHIQDKKDKIKSSKVVTIFYRKQLLEPHFQVRCECNMSDLSQVMYPNN